MEAIFSKILSMSLSASFVIGAVLLLRSLLGKAPKKYSYFLWLLVFVRLLCPFTLESPMSLVPVKEDAILYRSSDDGRAVKVDTGMEWVNIWLAGGMEDIGGEGIFQSLEDSVAANNDAWKNIEIGNSMADERNSHVTEGNTAQNPQNLLSIFLGAADTIWLEQDYRAYREKMESYISSTMD